MDLIYGFTDCFIWLLRSFFAGAYSLRTTYGPVPAVKRNGDNVLPLFRLRTFRCASPAQALPTHAADSRPISDITRRAGSLSESAAGGAPAEFPRKKGDKAWFY